jgi:radical SAM family uncharacterized protein/radical SAM-linked protein
VILNEHPYASFLHRVEKPARYVGGEYNQIVKEKASVRVRMALGFPDVYDIGMSHLGTKILYSLLNKHPGIAAERVFCPWPDMEKELRERGLPLLTLETASPLLEFDVVGFSLQYELTFTNILTMLDLSGIPLRSEHRDERHPLVIAGGPGATQPEPIAPMIDAFLVGDAEERLPEMLLRTADLKARGASRRELLIEIAKIEGFYVPSLYATEIDERTGFLVVGRPLVPGVPERVRRQVVEDLSRYPFPDDAPVAAAEAIFDRMAIEIARGCTEGCRFCQAGMIYRPVRERDPEEIVETIVSATKKGGYDEVGLTTLSTADYSCISPLIKKVMERLRPEKTSLSVASLRAYGLDEDLFDEIKTVRATGLTFAPEAGTERMREVISKNITEEDLTRTAHRVFSRGWRRMKLYFMIGLPTEGDEDVAGIMETGRLMREIGAEYHSRGAVGVTVAVSSHVPKPHTPFQWCAMDTLVEIERKQEMLFGLSRRYRLEFRRHDPRTSYLECVLGRGDRRLADVVEEAWRRGARYDSWDDHLRWDLWVEAMQAYPAIPFDLYLGTLPLDARLPWDHLDMRLEPKFLATEYRRAMKGKLSPPCGKPAGVQVHHTNLEDHAKDERIFVCYHCGVECDLTRMREERGEFLTKLGAFQPPRREGAPDAAGIAAVREGAVVREDAAGAAAPRLLDAGAALVQVETVEMPGETAPPDGPNGFGRAPRRNGSPAGRPPHDFLQGEPRRYRVRFSKIGVAALTGHLDLVRSLPRVMRRAGLQPYYSEGFHPKPVMEFSPPLPLGLVSLDEVVEICLAQDIPASALLERLNQAASLGLEFLAAEARPPGSPRLSKELAGVEYLVRVEEAHLLALGLDAKSLDEAPGRFLALDSASRDVERKGKTKSVDLRPAVDAVRWIAAEEIPSRLGFTRPDARYLFVRIRLDGSAHVRPGEVAAALLGADPGIEPVHLARLRLLAREGVGWRPLLTPSGSAGVLVG